MITCKTKDDNAFKLNYTPENDNDSTQHNEKIIIFELIFLI